jgi:hypothetical protein
MSVAGHGHGHGHDPGHGAPGNKTVALLISVFALVLAFSETLGKSAQTAALSYNVEASNLWSFFQSKTIRQTTLRTAAEQAEVALRQTVDAKAKEALEQRIAAWRKSVERYESEPETQEGRKELAARAKSAEQKRERSLAAYHHYEIASAALQIAIVLASATIITGMMWLLWIAGGLGVIGVAFCLIGVLAPTSLHLF